MTGHDHRGIPEWDNAGTEDKPRWRWRMSCVECAFKTDWVYQFTGSVARAKVVVSDADRHRIEGQ